MPGAAASLLLAAAVLAPLVDGEKLGDGWRLVTLPQQAKAVTRYSAELIDGRAALRIEAQASYGNLVHDVPARAVPGAPQRLRWSWRMQQPNAAVDLRHKRGDDAAVKVCLSFDLPLHRVPFMERQMLRLARLKSGEPLPAATLCWVWGDHEPHGVVMDNAYTRRVRYIVLRNAGDAMATWYDEGRDVAADLRRAFGDEIEQMPALTAVIVAGDADNTGAHSVAHISALRFEP